MINFKSFLQSHEHAWFCINKTDKKKFLFLAKQNGCKWINGDEINPYKDNCTNFMGINKNLQLGFVSAMCWCIDKNKITKIQFSDMKE